MNEVSEKEWRRVRQRVHGTPRKPPPERRFERLLSLSIEIQDWDVQYVARDKDGNLFIRAKHKGVTADHPWEELPRVLPTKQFHRLLRHIEDMVRKMDQLQKRRLVIDGVKEWRRLDE
jgi:hypothetical protein